MNLPLADKRRGALCWRLAILFIEVISKVGKNANLGVKSGIPS